MFFIATLFYEQIPSFVIQTRSVENLREIERSTGGASRQPYVAHSVQINKERHERKRSYYILPHMNEEEGDGLRGRTEIGGSVTGSRHSTQHQQVIHEKFTFQLKGLKFLQADFEISLVNLCWYPQKAPHMTLMWFCTPRLLLPASHRTDNSYMLSQFRFHAMISSIPHVRFHFGRRFSPIASTKTGSL